MDAQQDKERLEWCNKTAMHYMQNAMKDFPDDVRWQTTIRVDYEWISWEDIAQEEETYTREMHEIYFA